LLGHNPDGALDVAAKARRDVFTIECLCQNFGAYEAEVWDNVSSTGGGGNGKNRGGKGESANGQGA